MFPGFSCALFSSSVLSFCCCTFLFWNTNPPFASSSFRPKNETRNRFTEYCTEFSRYFSSNVRAVGSGYWVYWCHTSSPFMDVPPSYFWPKFPILSEKNEFISTRFRRPVPTRIWIFFSFFFWPPFILVPRPSQRIGLVLGFFLPSFFCNESLLTRVCSHFGPLAGRVFRNPRVCFAAFVLPRRRPCFYWLFYDDDYFWNGPTPKPLAPAEVPRHFFFFCSSIHSPRTPTWKLHRILWKTLAVGQNREKKLGKTQ